MLSELGPQPLPMIALAMAAFPAVMIFALIAYAIQAWFYLGHWPVCGNPDPKQLGWWVQHGALQLGLVASRRTMDTRR